MADPRPSSLATSSKSDADNKPPCKLILVEGSNLLARSLRAARLAEAALVQGPVTLIASAEVLALRDLSVHQQVFGCDERLKQLGIHLIRLASGCVCCSSKMVLNTHLGRTMRLRPPRVLVLELDTQSHASQIRQMFEQGQWEGWFSPIEVSGQEADNEHERTRL